MSDATFAYCACRECNCERVLDAPVPCADCARGFHACDTCGTARANELHASAVTPRICADCAEDAYDRANALRAG